MLKKTLFGAAIVAAAGFGTFTANQNNNQSQLSELQLENIEYLAEGDINGGTVGTCLHLFCGCKPESSAKGPRFHF